MTPLLTAELWGGGRLPLASGGLGELAVGCSRTAKCRGVFKEWKLPVGI